MRGGARQQTSTLHGPCPHLGPHCSTHQVRRLPPCPCWGVAPRGPQAQGDSEWELSREQGRRELVTMRRGWGWGQGRARGRQAPSLQIGLLHSVGSLPQLAASPALRASHLPGQSQPRARVGGDFWGCRLVPRPRWGLCGLSADQTGLSGQGSLPTPPAALPSVSALGVDLLSRPADSLPPSRTSVSPGPLG